MGPSGESIGYHGIVREIHQWTTKQSPVVRRTFADRDRQYTTATFWIKPQWLLDCGITAGGKRREKRRSRVWMGSQRRIRVSKSKAAAAVETGESGLKIFSIFAGIFGILCLRYAAAYIVGKARQGRCCNILRYGFTGIGCNSSNEPRQVTLKV